MKTIPVTLTTVEAPAIQVPGRVLVSIADTRIGSLVEERQRLREEPMDSTALHDFRVQVRRVQAVADMVYGCILPTDHARVAGRLAFVTRGLGKYRALDVVGEIFPKLLQRSSRKERAAGTAFLEWVRKRNRPGRRASVARAIRASSSKKVARPFQTILRSVPSQLPVSPLSFLAPRVALRSVRLGIDEARERDYHAFRLEMKGFRCALEALEADAKAFLPGRLRKAALEAQQVTRLLGRHQDADETARLMEKALRADAMKPWTKPLRSIQVRSQRVAQEALAEFSGGWNSLRWATVRSLIATEAHAASTSMAKAFTSRLT